MYLVLRRRVPEIILTCDRVLIQVDGLLCVEVLKALQIDQALHTIVLTIMHCAVYFAYSVGFAT